MSLEEPTEPEAPPRTMRRNSMQDKRPTWWDANGGRVAGAIIVALVLAAGSWGISMDRQSVEIGFQLRAISASLERQTQKLEELNAVEKRVQRLEDQHARAAADMAEIGRRLSLLESSKRKR